MSERRRGQLAVNTQPLSQLHADVLQALAGVSAGFTQPVCALQCEGLAMQRETLGRLTQMKFDIGSAQGDTETEVSVICPEEPS